MPKQQSESEWLNKIKCVMGQSIFLPSWEICIQPLECFSFLKTNNQSNNNKHKPLSLDCAVVGMRLLGFKLLLTKCVIQRQGCLWPKAPSCHTSLAWFPQKANFSLILGTLGPATLWGTFCSWGSERVWCLSGFAVRNCSKFHSNATVAPCSSSLQQSGSWWRLVFALLFFFSFISFAFRGYNYIFHSPLSSLQTLPYTLLCFFQLFFFPPSTVVTCITCLVCIMFLIYVFGPDHLVLNN